MSLSRAAEIGTKPCTTPNRNSPISYASAEAPHGEASAAAEELSIERGPAACCQEGWLAKLQFLMAMAYPGTVGSLMISLHRRHAAAAVSAAMCQQPWSSMAQNAHQFSTWWEAHSHDCCIWHSSTSLSHSQPLTLRRLAIGASQLCTAHSSRRFGRTAWPAPVVPWAKVVLPQMHSLR